MDDEATTAKLAAALRAFDAETGAGIPDDELADALLPVVREIAADQLERIADERTWVTDHDNEVVSARDLYEHIARLRGELEPVTYDFPPDECGHAFPHRYDPETGRCTCGALDHPDWRVTA